MKKQKKKASVMTQRLLSKEDPPCLDTFDTRGIATIKNHRVRNTL